MIKRNAIYLKFENDIIKISKDREFVLNGEFLYFKDINEVQILKELEVSLEYKDIDGWWQKFLDKDDADKVLNYLWGVNFNLDDEALKLNLIEYANELLDGF